VPKNLKRIGAFFAACLLLASCASVQNCDFDSETCANAWDFESGSMPPSRSFDNVHLSGDRFQVATGDAFAGERYGRVIVRPGNDAAIGRDGRNTERSEIKLADMKSLDGVIHMGVALRFGPEFKPHNKRTLIIQIKPEFDSGIKNSPQFALYSNRSTDRWKICNNIENLDGCIFRNGRLFKPNVWHRVLISQNASSGNDGWLKMYVDGRLVYTHRGPTKYDKRAKHFSFRTGIYRDNVDHVQTLDVDNFMVSRDLNAVASFLNLDASKLR